MQQCSQNSNLYKKKYKFLFPRRQTSLQIYEKVNGKKMSVGFSSVNFKKKTSVGLSPVSP